MFYGIYLPVFLPYVAITILGLLNLYVLDNNLFIYQLAFFVLSLVIFFVVSTFPTHFHKKYSYPLYVINIVLLLLVFIMGEITRGSTRWINLGVVNIQPSEFIKVTLILAIANLLSYKTKKIISIQNFLYATLIFLPAFALVFFQPDLGTSLVLIAVFGILIFYSGVRVSYVLLILLLFSIASGPVWNSLRGYQQDRVVSFINPSLDPLGTGYNAIQAQIAIGSGKLTGKGLGAGTQARLGFLPENTTDFAFAAFAEEWGAIGSSILILLYFIILYSILNLFTRVKDYFARYVILGVVIVFFVHISINIGMNIGIMPVTGIPLPFFSYGGSSFLALSIMLGLVNSVAKDKQLI